jgi:hypothetical protein
MPPSSLVMRIELISKPLYYILVVDVETKKDVSETIHPNERFGHQNRTRSSYRRASIPLSKSLTKRGSQQINSLIIFFRYAATDNESDRSIQSVSTL